MNAATLNRAKGLTRLAVIIGLMIAGFSFFANQSAQATATSTNVNFHYVTVGAGDTLWSIAAHYAPNADRRDTVNAIVTLNNLQSATLQPGQRIALPNN